METTLTKASGCENNLRLMPIDRTVAFWTKQSGLLLADYGQLDIVTINGCDFICALFDLCTLLFT